jgi:CRISPR system Cascade subunit CasE
MSDLFLLHTRPDPRRLAIWAGRQRLIQTSGDSGYAVHALLRAAFGKDSPQPFVYQDADRGLLAYTTLHPAELARRVALADPEVAATLGLAQSEDCAGYAVRAFPTNWSVGTELGFEVRLRPVVREGATGKEIDAFLHAVERSEGADLDRATVYLRWLRDHLAILGGRPRQGWQGAVDIIEARVQGFRLVDVMRRTQASPDEMGRRSQVVTGPDVTLSGTLRVLDSGAFGMLLSRGLGRHRAFGFGMLLLRPAR